MSKHPDELTEFEMSPEEFGGDMKKILSKTFGIPEENLHFQKVSEKGLKTFAKNKKEALKVIPPTEEEKLLNKINFLKQILADGMILSCPDGMFHQPILEEEVYRQQVQDKLMQLVMKYVDL